MAPKQGGSRIRAGITPPPQAPPREPHRTPPGAEAGPLPGVDSEHRQTRPAMRSAICHTSWSPFSSTFPNSTRECGIGLSCAASSRKDVEVGSLDDILVCYVADRDGLCRNPRSVRGERELRPSILMTFKRIDDRLFSSYSPQIRRSVPWSLEPDIVIVFLCLLHLLSVTGSTPVSAAESRAPRFSLLTSRGLLTGTAWRIASTA